MFESMYAARGVGLAAPQIGIAKRIAVIDVSTGEDPSQKIVLINPEIVSREGAQTGEEGCLSLPTFPRARHPLQESGGARARRQRRGVRNGRRGFAGARDPA